MNAHEIRIAQANQALCELEEIKKGLLNEKKSKKIVLKMELIQLFSKLEID